MMELIKKFTLPTIVWASVIVALIILAVAGYIMGSKAGYDKGVLDASHYCTERIEEMSQACDEFTEAQKELAVTEAFGDYLDCI